MAASREKHENEVGHTTVFHKLPEGLKHTKSEGRTDEKKVTRKTLESDDCIQSHCKYDIMFQNLISNDLF